MLVIMIFQNVVKSNVEYVFKPLPINNGSFALAHAWYPLPIFNVQLSENDKLFILKCTRVLKLLGLSRQLLMIFSCAWRLCANEWDPNYFSFYVTSIEQI